MRRWTEIKCYMCSRVCGEVAGAWGRIIAIPIGSEWSPGAFCKLTARRLRCTRCGGPVYLGDVYAEYSPPEAAGGVTNRAQTAEGPVPAPIS